MSRKGMEMPLVLVVGAVVLIVISLIVISITSGGLTKFFGTTTTTAASADTGIKSEYKSTLEQLDAIDEGGTTGTTAGGTGGISERKASTGESCTSFCDGAKRYIAQSELVGGNADVIRQNPNYIACGC